MSSRRDLIQETLAANHAASLAILRAVSPEQWAQPVPSDEGAAWTAHDVLAHLALAENGQLGQIKRLLADEQTVPVDFDLTRYNRSSVKKRADQPPADLLNEIEAAYAQLLATLTQLDEAQLDRAGRHSRGDTLTVEQFFLRISQHRRDHAHDLQRALAL